VPDVFLSYNREDQAVARLFADAFSAQGFEVWWDVGLKAGEAYDEVTETALRTAKAVVVLWSKKSVVSRWVRAEATLADRNKSLVPCMIEPCERPIMFELTQTTDLSHWRGGANDKAWLAFVGDVRTFIAARAGAGSVAAATPSPTVPARAGREGERRQVAVLSCMPSMPPDSEMDPDDWQEAVAAFQARASKAVLPLDGQLIDAPGDGVLALFGLDHAREDDAERAVRAGFAVLELAREGGPGTGPRLSVRAGVDVGPVVLGSERTAPAGAPIGGSAQLVNGGAKVHQPGGVKVHHLG
jgi:class 3 adenylate cyclase